MAAGQGLGQGSANENSCVAYNSCIMPELPPLRHLFPPAPIPPHPFPHPHPSGLLLLQWAEEMTELYEAIGAEYVDGGPGQGGRGSKESEPARITLGGSGSGSGGDGSGGRRGRSLVEWFVSLEAIRRCCEESQPMVQVRHNHSPYPKPIPKPHARPNPYPTQTLTYR